MRGVFDTNEETQRLLSPTLLVYDSQIARLVSLMDATKQAADPTWQAFRPLVSGLLAERDVQRVQQQTSDVADALAQKVATAAAFNRAVYERQKPGGRYVIVDDAAAAGSGTSDTQALHRIDPASVREEVEAAGFVLDAVNTLLAKKDDPHSIKVFDPSIKGETDRFAYRFVKP